MITETTMYNVKNRSSSMVVYKIPETNLRREFAPGEVKKIPFGELEKLTYQPGGRELIENFLQIIEQDVTDTLNVKREPEYNMSEAEIRELLTTGSLDEFLDALDFAPIGVIDLIKTMAVQLPLGDMAKRKALKDKTGFDLDKALVHIEEEKFFLFDYETKERTDTELTKKMSELLSRRFSEDIKFNMDKRMIISHAAGSPYSVWFVLKWNENFENVKMIPFNFLVPKEKFIGEVQAVSKDFDWVLLRISGYEGLKNESLLKYAFMKIDESTPALFSPLVILDEYHDPGDKWRYTSFFEHPKYGTCLFFTQKDRKQDKYVSAFYKMSDVQAEIDKIFLEK